MVLLALCVYSYKKYLKERAGNIRVNTGYNQLLFLLSNVKYLIEMAQ